MKKKYRISIILILIILFAPIPSGVYKDGGTRTFSALTYKVVKWNRLVNTEDYKNTSVYWFPNNFKSLNELWEIEPK